MKRKLRRLRGHAAGWRYVHSGHAGYAAFLSALLVLGSVDVLTSDAAAETARTDNKKTALHATNKDVRRLQRLLKLLANQHPARFASVDPGVIDGRFGPGTIVAIRNFQRIRGVPETGAITRELYTQIITAQSESPAPTVTLGVKDAQTASPPKPVAPPKGVAPASNRFAQLGSIKDESQVVREWARLQQANPEYLKGRTPVIEAANLGDRGTYYRILVGPFENFERAKSFCDALQKQKQSCLVKKRSGATNVANNQPAQTRSPETVEPEPASPPKPVATADPVVSEKTSDTNPPAAPVATGKPNSPADPPAQAAAVKAAEQPIVENVETKNDVLPLSALPTTTVDASVDAAAGAPQTDSAQSDVPGQSDGTADAKPQPTPKSLTDAQSERTKLANLDTGPKSSDKADQAVSSDTKPHRATQSATTLVQWLARVDRYSLQSYLGPTVAAAAGTAFGLLLLVWRQRRRRDLVFESMLVTPWFEDTEKDNPGRVEPLPRNQDEPTGLLEELRSQFDADDLVASRNIRDTFLQEIPELKDGSATGYSGEHAMLVNRKLNQLLSSDPDSYKSIFLNWIFLNHVADKIASSDYTIKRLDPRIQYEFRLLATLFKIHLLELEARHHVRQRLPNIYTALHDL